MTKRQKLSDGTVKSIRNAQSNVFDLLVNGHWTESQMATLLGIQKNWSSSW